MCNFRKLNEAEVICSNGFTFKYGRSELTYKDGSKYLIVPIEHLSAPYEMAIYLNMSGEWMEKGISIGKPSTNDLDIVEQRVRDSLSFLQRNFSIIR